jgi:hypothetical protein
MGKYEEGTRVRVKPDVSATGNYGAFAGMPGTVKEARASYLKTVKLDSGDELHNVGKSVVEVVEEEPEEDEGGPSAREKAMGLKAEVAKLKSKLEEARLKLHLVESFGLTWLDEDVIEAARALRESGKEDYSFTTLFTVAYGQVNWPERAKRVAEAAYEFTSGDKVRVRPEVDWSEYHSEEPGVKKPGFAPAMEGLQGEVGTVRRHTGRGFRVAFERAGGKETWTLLGRDLEPA